MRLLAVGCLAIVAGSCATAADPCAKISGTCIAVTVSSRVVKQVDTLVFAAGDPINGMTTSSVGHPSDLPIHLAVTIPATVSGGVRFDVTGLLNHVEAGVGSAQTVLQSGAHTAMSIDLEPSGSAGPDDGGDDLPSTDMSLGSAVAARLIGPLSTSTVTNHRPHVHWELPTGAMNPVLEFCSTRACTQTVTPGIVDASGASGTPSSDLPVGTVFWRVRTSDGTAEAISATWELKVGKRVQQIESVDTSWGTFVDVNGDGRGDIVVGAPTAAVKGAANVGRVYIFHSGDSGIATTPQIIDGAGAESRFGSLVLSAGDVNGDGYADLVVVDGASQAFVFHGGPAGLMSGATPNTTIPAFVYNQSLAAAGDIDGDGYADLVVGAPQSGMPGVAFVLRGSANGVSKTATWTVNGSEGANGATSPQFGISIAGVGDVNGDGYGDVLVAAPDQSHPSTTNVGNAYLYLGGTTKLAPWPGGPLSDVSVAQYATLVWAANDLNADGYADIIIASANQTLVTFLGGPTSLNVGPSMKDAQSGSGFGSLQSTAAGVGDVNGDGLSDIVVGAPFAYPGTGGVPGAIHVFLATTSSGSLTLNEQGPTRYGPDGDDSSFGVVGVPGDVDGDGRNDVLVGATCAPTASGACGNGTAYLFRGGPTGLPATADQKWVGGDQGGHFGIVAR